MEDFRVVETFLSRPLRDLPGGSHFPGWVQVWHVLMLKPKAMPMWHYLTNHQSFHHLQSGDIIVISSATGWLTYAVVSSTLPRNETVICFTDHNGRPVLDMEAFFRSHVRLREVHISRLCAIMQPNASYFVVHQHDKAMTLRRAYNILMGRNTEWNFFCFNSEHFASCAFHGKAQSQQVLNLLNHVLHDATTAIKRLGVCSMFLAKAAKDGAGGVVKEASDETLTALGKVTGKAKASLLGIIIEVGICCYRLVVTFDQFERGAISQEQCCQKVGQTIGSSSGIITGGIVGASIGAAIIPIPIVGSFIGGAVGGAVGRSAGRSVGGKVGECVAETTWMALPY